MPHAITFFVTAPERAAILRALRRLSPRSRTGGGRGGCGGREAALRRALRLALRRAREPGERRSR